LEHNWKQSPTSSSHASYTFGSQTFLLFSL